MMRWPWMSAGALLPILCSACGVGTVVVEPGELVAMPSEPPSEQTARPDRVAGPSISMNGVTDTWAPPPTTQPTGPEPTLPEKGVSSALAYDEADENNLCMASGDVPADAQPRRWRLAWHDEFNGPQPGDDPACFTRTPQCNFVTWGIEDCPADVWAQLKDLNKCTWSVYAYFNYMPPMDDERQKKNAFDPGEVKVEDGALVLSARSQGSSHDNCGKDWDDPRTSPWQNQTTDCPYLSGGVQTQPAPYADDLFTEHNMQGFDFRYGRIEAKIKLPGGPGAWPAFWLLPAAASTWPDDGEVDILESWANTDHRVTATYHDGIASQGIHTNRGFRHNSEARFYPENGRRQTFAEDFHIYAVEWTPTELRFFVDTWLIGVIQNGDTNGNDPSFPFQVPDKMLYAILNYTVKPITGNWLQRLFTDCDPDPDDFEPRQMLVDYVRVFELVDFDTEPECQTGGLRDDVGCRLMEIPAGVAPFVVDSSLYYGPYGTGPDACPHGGERRSGGCLLMELPSGVPTFMANGGFYAAGPSVESTITQFCTDPCQGQGQFDGFGCYLGTAPEGYVAKVRNGRLVYRRSFLAGLLQDEECLPEHPLTDDGCLFGVVPAGREAYTDGPGDGLHSELERFYLRPLCSPLMAVADCVDPCPSGGFFTPIGCQVTTLPENAPGFVYDGNLYITRASGAEPCPCGGTFDGANCLVFDTPAGLTTGLSDDGRFFIEPACGPVPFFLASGY